MGVSQRLMDAIKRSEDIFSGFYFTVEMLEQHSRTTEDIKMFGTYMSDNEAFNKNVSSRVIRCNLNVKDMVEYHARGVSISIVKEKEIIEVYNIIDEYVSLWADFSKDGVNNNDIPYQNLINCERFANSVFEVARYLFVENKHLEHFQKAINEVQSINLSNLFVKETELPDYVEREGSGFKINDDKLPKRVKNEEYFKEQLLSYFRD